MIFKYKPTKFRTHGRLLQSPRGKVKAPKRKVKFINSRFGYQSLARA